MTYSLLWDLSRGEDDPSTLVTLNFVEAKARGIIGGYGRACNGLTPDKTYPIFRKNAKAAGMAWGAFGTIFPSPAIKDQVGVMISILGDDTGELPLVLDWEVEGVTWNMAYEYIALLQARYPGKEILIYSRTEYLKRMLPNRFLQPNSYSWFTKFGLWIAQYGVSKPNLPPGWTDWVLWQWTDRVSRPDYSSTGESLSFDGDYFNGDWQTFNARFNIGPVIIPPPPTPGTDEFSGGVLTVTFDANMNPSSKWSPNEPTS